MNIISLLTDPEIRYRKIKDVPLKGGILVDGFPSVGLANAIASECLVHSLQTEFVGVIDSPSFPALSLIRNAMPNFPARVYANPDLKLAVFVSELNLDPSLFTPVALAMLQWALDSGCNLLISAAGMPYENDENIVDQEPQVYAVGSTPSALKRAAQVGIPPMMSASITGIPAVLLNEGFWKNFDVLVLLVKVMKDAPDFRAGAAVAMALSQLVPGASCDIRSLLKEAEIIENNMKKARKEQLPGPVREMYG